MSACSDYTGDMWVYATFVRALSAIPLDFGSKPPHAVKLEPVGTEELGNQPDAQGPLRSRPESGPARRGHAPQAAQPGIQPKVPREQQPRPRPVTKITEETRQPSNLDDAKPLPAQAIQPTPILHKMNQPSHEQKMGPSQARDLTARRVPPVETATG